VRDGPLNMRFIVAVRLPRPVLFMREVCANVKSFAEGMSHGDRCWRRMTARMRTRTLYLNTSFQVVHTAPLRGGAHNQTTPKEVIYG